METITWLWEWYKTIVGVVTLLGITIVTSSLIVYYLWWRSTRGKCPECGGYKFMTMIGGPPKCIKCGWQHENFPWSKKHPNFEKRHYHIVK